MATTITLYQLIFEVKELNDAGFFIYRVSPILVTIRYFPWCSVSVALEYQHATCSHASVFSPEWTDPGLTMCQ